MDDTGEGLEGTKDGPSLVPSKPSPSLLILWGIAPWPIVWLALEVFHSAILAFIFYHGVCLAGMFFLRKNKNDTNIAQSEISPLPWQNLILGTVVMNVLTVILYKVIGTQVFPAEEVVPKLTNLGVTQAQFWPIALYFVFVNPIIEENFWRGTILRHWQQHVSINQAIFLSSIFFASWHFLPTRLFVPNILWLLAGLGAILFLGTGLAHLVQKTGKITEAIFLHAFAADLPVMIILYLLLHSN